MRHDNRVLLATLRLRSLHVISQLCQLTRTSKCRHRDGPQATAARVVLGELGNLAMLADVASRRPVLSCIDDGQWPDRESLGAGLPRAPGARREQRLDFAVYSSTTDAALQGLADVGYFWV